MLLFGFTAHIMYCTVSSYRVSEHTYDERACSRGTQLALCIVHCVCIMSPSTYEERVCAIQQRGSIAYVVTSPRHKVGDCAIGLIVRY